MTSRVRPRTRTRLGLEIFTRAVIFNRQIYERRIRRTRISYDPRNELAVNESLYRPSPMYSPLVSRDSARLEGTLSIHRSHTPRHFRVSNNSFVVIVNESRDKAIASNLSHRLIPACTAVQWAYRKRVKKVHLNLSMGAARYFPLA